MKYFKHILGAFLGVLVCSVSLKAQFYQQTSLYIENMYLLNPASIGQSNFLRGSFVHRDQWRGIKGAPRSNAFAISSPVNENVFLGGVFLNDKEDLLERTSGVITYAQRFRLDQDQSIFFGLSGGFGQTKINIEDARVDDFSDNVLGLNQNNASIFAANFGAFYTYKFMFAGFAIPNFAKFKTNKVTFGDIGVKGLKESPLIHAGLTLKSANKQVKITPQALYRFAPNGRSQYDLLMRLDYKNRFWLGAMYREQNGIISMLGVSITDQLQIAYSYEGPYKGIAVRSNGTHEFMVSLNLRAVSSGLKKRDYERKKRFVLANPKDSSLVGPPVPDYLGGKKPNVSVTAALNSYSEQKRQKELVGTFKEVNKQGDVGEDAESGFYVVVAALRTKERALIHAERFRAERNLEVDIILNDKKSWYLLTAERFDNKNQALLTAIKYRKMGFNGTWVFINR